METITMSEQSYQELLEDVRKELQEICAKKKDRVLELAKKLEKDGVKPEHIANHIVHDLDDLVSKRWIYDILPDEYKQKEKQHKKEEVGAVPHQTTEIEQEDGTVLLNKQGDDLTEEEHKPDQNNTPTNTIHATNVTNVEKIDKSQSPNNENKIINPKQLAEAIKEAIISSMKESNIQVVDLDPVQCIRCKYPQFVKVNSKGRMVLD